MTHTIVSTDELKAWMDRVTAVIETQGDLDATFYQTLIQVPEVSVFLIQQLDLLPEHEGDEEDSAAYSACIFVIELYVAQLQSALECGHKMAEKKLHELMACLAQAIERQTHSLGFWLPVLNAFYDVHAVLSDELKKAYLDLATLDEERSPDEVLMHFSAIRGLIEELSYLSVFDIAENFFAQSYAMPADFFADLVMDLYSIDEGHEIALLTLLHPDREVREVVIETLELLMSEITLSPIALTRLQSIKAWYPESYHAQMNRWIKNQRKKGVVFYQHEAESCTQFKATEVDGSGAQGIFFTLSKKRQHRLCGLLFKQQVGIRESWLTATLSASDVKRYHKEAFDDRIMLRNVDLSYVIKMTNHFLAVMVEQHTMPDLHLLEIQEALGVVFVPQRMNVEALFEDYVVPITPFTQDRVQLALKRSISWAKRKHFIESWYQENRHIDKLVTRCCVFVDGVRRCRLDEAIALVFAQDMEPNRDSWCFHFLWMALWLRSGARTNEKTWEDAFIIAHLIRTGTPLNEIPILKDICYQSVTNSLETMQERRTYLSQE